MMQKSKSAVWESDELHIFFPIADIIIIKDYNENILIN